MKHGIIFNFFDEQKVLESLGRYFNLYIKEVTEYIEVVNWDNGKYFKFAEHFALDMGKFDAKKICITAKHITTSNDGGKSLEKYGLLNLKDVIEKPTPLNKFLERYGISFDIDNKKMFFKEMVLDLFNGDEACNICIYGKDVCPYYDYSSCKYRRVIGNLYTKFYYDKCETEVFLCGDDDEIMEYSTVKRFPEILIDIEDVLKSLKHLIPLSQEWQQYKGAQAYILEFDINIGCLEFINKKNTHEYHYGRYLNLSKYSYDDLQDNIIPQEFYSNIFILENSIGRIVHNRSKKYGQIYPDAVIPYSKLRIKKI